MSISKQQFKNLVDLDIRGEVEQNYKGLNYLSWATAYQLMMEQDPTATYEVLKAQDGLPYFTRDGVHMVFTRVTMFGETKEMWLSVMDNKNNAVKVPTSNDVSNNIMRCLVKNIAMFGIGLRLYKGDDLSDYQVDDALINVIATLVKELGISKSDVQEMSNERYEKDNVRLLSKDQASDFIKFLQATKRDRQRHNNETSAPVVEAETSEAPKRTVKKVTTNAPEPTPEVEVAAEIQPVTQVQSTPSVEVQVEQTAPVAQPSANATDLLTAEQYKEITAIYREKKITKDQLKNEILKAAPNSKGVKELTQDQANAVINNLKAFNAPAA